MASIPGWVYAIVGGGIAFFAKYVSAKSESQALELFFWVGILLIAVGIFKIIIGYVTGARDRLRTDESAPQGRRIRSEPERPAYAKDAIYCARCNAKLHPQSRYCNWCGTRV